MIDYAGVCESTVAERKLDKHSVIGHDFLLSYLNQDALESWKKQ